MVADEQTHKLPEADSERARIAALSGDKTLAAFDARVERLLRAVNARYGELFAEDEDLSSAFGSLVFTGVEDDPETLRTLKRMGFTDAPRISATIRAWHHGRIGATRTEQGRELFTRLAPRLLEAAQATGAPDEAFRRFADFFASLRMGVQVQSLFLAQPKLFELIVRVMAFAPRLAAFLARSPAALDSMMDTGFFAPFAEGEIEAALAYGLARTEPGFEAAMDAVRRVHREQAFRVGVQVMSGSASAAEAGPAFADLADACIRALAAAALAEVERLAGALPGEVAVIALGKCGSREMTAGSDLDLMTLYRPSRAGAQSAGKGWAGETFFARFTQRLIAALSAPTPEGGLYEVDMRLRPSGSQGPVAVSQAAFESYYAGEAETWEFLALTRARVVWASSPTFAAGRRRRHRGGAAPAARSRGHLQGRGRDAGADGQGTAAHRFLGPQAFARRPDRHRVRRPASADPACRVRWTAAPQHRRSPGAPSRRRAWRAGGQARPCMPPGGCSRICRNCSRWPWRRTPIRRTSRPPSEALLAKAGRRATTSSALRSASAQPARRAPIRRFNPW